MHNNTWFSQRIKRKKVLYQVIKNAKQATSSDQGQISDDQRFDPGRGRLYSRVLGDSTPWILINIRPVITIACTTCTFQNLSGNQCLSSKQLCLVIHTEDSDAYKLLDAHIIMYPECILIDQMFLTLKRTYYRIPTGS